MVELEYFDWKDLIFGKYWTAGHGVFMISCPEAVGKHCNSRKKQNTSISVEIEALSRGNKNSITLDDIARIF